MSLPRTIPALLGAFVLLCSWTSRAQTEADDAQLTRLYQEDQKDREGLFSSEGSRPTRRVWEELARRDEERRQKVLEMVGQDRLHTAGDYFHAAMVLQHGSTPEHYLLAHVLSTVAGFKGHTSGKWLSAASLDRYLHKTDRSQIFGTQRLRESGSQWTQEPFHRILLTDRVRAEYTVPPLAEQ